MSDLFGSPPLPGLCYGGDIIDPAEEARLIEEIDASGLTPFRFQGWTGKRQTASFGWHYDFDERSFAPALPIPEWLMALRERAARFAGLGDDDLVQVLLIRYDPGAGIGWHRDKAVFGQVIGISLGGPATLRFRRRRAQGFDRSSVRLAPRSIYLLSGEARHIWEHSIAPTDMPRWSITFRGLAAAGSAQKHVQTDFAALSRGSPRKRVA